MSRLKLLPENPPNISERSVRVAWTVVIALAMVVLAATVVGLVRLSNENESYAGRLERSDAELAKLNERLNDEHAAAQALNEQVKRLGGKPVVDPGDPATPIPGPVLATQAQVNEAVSVICAGTSSCRPTEAQVKTTLRAICGDCRGEDARPPKDGVNGQNATPEQIDAAIARQIDAAVARHCGEDECRGPGVTDQQIDERIAAYCTQDGNCGKDGKDGVDGKDATITPSGMDCPDRERVNGVHIAADGTLTVSCAPFIGRE